MAPMTARAATPAAVLARLFPVIWSDAHYVAVGKPPRVNFESAAWPHGPRVIDVVLEQLEQNQSGGKRPAAVFPLILPERLASGVGLFARTGEARRKFTETIAARPVRYTHIAIVRGNPPRPRMAVKPGAGRRPKSDRARSDPPPATARLELLASHQNQHVVRCSTTAAGWDDLRKLLRAAGGLDVVGDIRPGPYTANRRTSPTRRPLVHLERLAFPHPYRRGDVEIVDPAPRAFPTFLTSGTLLEEHLRAALAARLALLVAEDTNAFRLFVGRNEGIAGLVVDKLADTLLIETLEGHFRGDEVQLRTIANWYTRVLGVKNVLARQVPRRREGETAAEPERAVRVLKGAPEEELSVKENGVLYVSRPEAGWSTGLFLDQRDNRNRIARLAAGKDVLNLFAYTCGFSVAAAHAGAASTTSVDLSAGNLEWGKRNFAANGIGLDNHQFIRSDAFEYLKRARRQGLSFDVVVVDPPTFARSKKPRRTFEVRRHLAELAALAAELVRPGGHMLVSTNYRQMTTAGLVARVSEALAERPHRIVAQPKLPLDFAADPDYQKSVLVRLR